MAKATNHPASITVPARRMVDTSTAAETTATTSRIIRPAADIPDVHTTDIAPTPQTTDIVAPAVTTIAAIRATTDPVRPADITRPRGDIIPRTTLAEFSGHWSDQMAAPHTRSGFLLQLMRWLGYPPSRKGIPLSRQRPEPGFQPILLLPGEESDLVPLCAESEDVT